MRAEIHELAEISERLSKRPYDTLSSSKLEQCESRWKAVADHADPELRGRVQQWIEQAQETIAEHLREVAAKASRELAAANAAAEERRLREERAQASAAAAAEQAQLLGEQKRAQSEKQQLEQKPAREIEGLVRKALEALGEGSTSRASAMRRTIEEKLAEAAPLSASLSGQIQQLDKQLADLRDWKSFSVAPKRAELIEEMELLVEVSLVPLALANRI